MLALNKIINHSRWWLTTGSKLEVQRLDPKSDKNWCNNGCIAEFAGS